MKRSGGQAVRRSVLLGVLLLGCPTLAAAQDSASTRPARTTDSLTARPPGRPAAADTTAPRRPTTPTAAMFRSFLLPGWGQATYGRKVTAGVMMGFEGLSVGMLLKVKSDERYIQETHSTKLKDKHQQEQDWITLIVFNHLMSGLEAYVSAHLFDFPGDLQMRALPGGGMGMGVTLPLGPR